MVDSWGVMKFGFFNCLASLIFTIPFLISILIYIISIQNQLHVINFSLRPSELIVRIIVTSI